MPPVRPADLILASATDQTRDAVAPRGSLPQVITAGVDRAPTGALGLAEGLLEGKDSMLGDSALLAKAAALTAPLPPMPIPNAGGTAAAPQRARGRWSRSIGSALGGRPRAIVWWVAVRGVQDRRAGR